jgi:hypothetical protein
MIKPVTVLIEDTGNGNLPVCGMALDNNTEDRATYETRHPLSTAEPHPVANTG